MSVTVAENIDGVLALVHTECIAPGSFLLTFGTVTLNGIHERRCGLCREWIRIQPEASVQS